MENQDKIMQALAKLLTYSEYVLQSIKENPIGAWPLPATHVEAMMNLIATLDNLQQLEASLKDESTMQKYIQSMSFICGTSSKSNGIDCCYKLVDYFITRQFLLQCSWTGGSRAAVSNSFHQRAASTDFQWFAGRKVEKKNIPQYLYKILFKIIIVKQIHFLYSSLQIWNRYLFKSLRCFFPLCSFLFKKKKFNILLKSHAISFYPYY